MLNRRHLLVLTAAAGTSAWIPRNAAGQTPAVPSGAEAAFDRDASAEELVMAMFTVQSGTGSDTGTVGTTDEQDAAAERTISPFLDAAYQMQRASGERYVASTYVSADVDEFEIVGVLETRPADGLVVARYAARTPGATTADTSMVLSGDLAPRLTVFHWDDAAGQWKVLSHATFNTPIAAICEQDALAPPSFPEVSTREEDVALGVKLVEEYAQLAVDGDTRPMLDPQVQVQAGNGRGYTTAAEWIPTKFSAVDLADFLVTRNDDVLVVSCTAVQAGLALGEAAGSAPEPRLTTFRLDESGTWKVVAHANFVVASALPDGVECVPAG